MIYGTLTANLVCELDDGDQVMLKVPGSDDHILMNVAIDDEFTIGDLYLTTHDSRVDEYNSIDSDDRDYCAYIKHMRLPNRKAKMSREEMQHALLQDEYTIA